jgi:hypothetical protein
MVLIVILNAVLAVLIVSVIVALHTVAILGDRPRRGRATPVRAGRVRPEAPTPVRPQPRPTVPQTSEAERIPVGV